MMERGRRRHLLVYHLPGRPANSITSVGGFAAACVLNVTC
jgi:hypothetical protein